MQGLLNINENQKSAISIYPSFAHLALLLMKKLQLSQIGWKASMSIYIQILQQTVGLKLKSGLFYCMNIITFSSR